MGYQRAETLLLMSLHMASEIHAFFHAFLDSGFGTSLCRDVNIPYYLIRAVGEQRGTRLCPQMYLEFFLSGALWRQLRTI